jgi:hypothetical protein
MAWVRYYAECAGLWGWWGLRVAWSYASAYLVTYTPFGLFVVSLAANFYLLLDINIGAVRLRKQERQGDSL